MLKFFLLFIFLIFFYTKNLNQKCIYEKFDFADIDNQGNSYFVKNDQIKKYNIKGELIKVFSNKKLGSISSIDVSNPLRILLFYKDQSAVLFLDSQLSEQSDKLDLNLINLEQSVLACTSVNNSVWLFNKQNCELVRLDKNKNINTGNLNTLLSIDLNPSFMLEFNNYLYLNDPNIGIILFDIFGAYFKTLPIKSINKFNVVGNKIYYKKENKFYSYELKNYETEEIEEFSKYQIEMLITENFQLRIYNDSTCISLRKY
jgi:hypothetical protein